jgi:hypothetical protein
LGNYYCGVIVWILPSDELLFPPDDLAKKTYINLIKQYLHKWSSQNPPSYSEFVKFINTQYPEKNLEDTAKFEKTMFLALNHNSQRYLESLIPGRDQDPSKL